MKTNYLNRYIIIVLGFAILAGGCTKNDDNRESRLRFANFLLPSDRARVVMDGPSHQEFPLDYGKSTGYKKFSEGKYNLKVFTPDNRLIIQKELGIGTGSEYTICASGIIPENASAPVRTTKTRLLEIFEGATAHPANAGMPMANIFLDRFEGSSQKAKLKAIHLVPALSGLDIYIKNKGEFSKLTTITYPEPSTRNYSLEPGTYTMQLRPESSEAILYAGRINVNAGELTTLVIYSKKSDFPYALQVLQLQSK